MKHSLPILKGIAIILLLFAVAGHFSRDFYVLLRWVICLISSGSVVWAWRHRQPAWIGLFAVIVIIFNPLIPFYMGRHTWKLLDIVSAAIFAASLFSDYYPQYHKSN